MAALKQALLPVEMDQGPKRNGVKVLALNVSNLDCESETFNSLTFPQPLM